MISFIYFLFQKQDNRKKKQTRQQIKRTRMCYLIVAKKHKESNSNCSCNGRLLTKYAHYTNTAGHYLFWEVNIQPVHNTAKGMYCYETAKKVYCTKISTNLQWNNVGQHICKCVKLCSCAVCMCSVYVRCMWSVFLFCCMFVFCVFCCLFLVFVFSVCF